jgi:transcriptional regulator with XRE-family HTH domain
MSPLGKLIESRRSELNLSYEDIAKRGGFPKATVYALSTKKVHRTVPRMTTLASLAKGLSLPLDVVRQAAALSAGYATPTIDLQEQEDTAAIFAAVNEMTDSQRATLRQIATAMIR